MDEARKLMSYDTQRLYPIPSAAFNDVRLTSGGQSGACQDLLGRPSPLTPVDFMTNIPVPYSYVVPSHGWALPPYLGQQQQQKQPPNHHLLHRQRIGGNLNLGASGIYSDSMTSFYGVPSRNLWGYPNQLDPALFASYWLHQQQHHHQQQQHHQQFSHIQAQGCDLDLCHRERRRRPKSPGKNRMDEDDDIGETEDDSTTVHDSNVRRAKIHLYNRSNNKNNNNGYHDDWYSDRHHHLRHDIKEDDDDDDVAILGVESATSASSSKASDVVQSRYKIEAMTCFKSSPSSSSSVTVKSSRIYTASPDTTTATSSSLMTSSDRETDANVKRELDLGYHQHNDHLVDHHHRHLPPHRHHPSSPLVFKMEPEAVPPHQCPSKNNLSSKNSLGSNFRISELIATTGTTYAADALFSPSSGVKIETETAGNFKRNSKSPTDSKPTFFDFHDELRPSFICRSISSSSTDRLAISSRVKCEDTITVTSSSPIMTSLMDVKLEESRCSPPGESKSQRSNLLMSELEKNIGSFQKSQKLSLEIPDSISCVSLSCHLGEYRVSHQKSGHKRGKVHAPTYLPEIGQPDTIIPMTSTNAAVPTRASVFCSTSEARHLSTKKRKKSSSSSSSSSRLEPSASPSVAVVVAPSDSVKREFATASFLDEEQVKSEVCDHQAFQGSNPSDVRECKLSCRHHHHDDVTGRDEVTCRLPVDSKECLRHEPSSLLVDCLSTRPCCMKSFTAVNSPAVPVGVSKALQRSCNSIANCWRSSSCMEYNESKDYALIPHRSLSSTEESKFLDTASTNYHQTSSSPPPSSSYLNLGPSHHDDESYSLLPPRHPHDHCSHHPRRPLECLPSDKLLRHPRHSHGNGCHDDDDDDDDCKKDGDDNDAGDSHHISLPLDLTKNKQRITMGTCGWTATPPPSSTVCTATPSSRLPFTCFDASGDSKFCLCCCSCCCLFKSRLLSKACSNFFASTSSSSSSLPSSSSSSLYSTSSLLPPKKMTSFESRATSPMEWSTSFPSLHPTEKTFKDSETQTETEVKTFPAPPTHSTRPTIHPPHVVSSSSSSSLSTFELGRSDEAVDEIFDLSGLSMLSSVADLLGPASTPQLSILDIPVSVFLAHPGTSPADVPEVHPETPAVEPLPPSPDLTLNYNVPSVGVFFPVVSRTGDDNDRIQMVFPGGDGVVETVGVVEHMLDNEMDLRRKIQEVKTLYQQGKKEVAKLERLSSQKAKNKKQRKDHHQTTSTTSAAATTTTTTSSSSSSHHGTKSRHTSGHKATITTSHASNVTTTPIITTSTTQSLVSSMSPIKFTSTPSLALVAPTLTSASLEPVQVRGGGSEEPPMLSMSGLEEEEGKVKVELGSADGDVHGGTMSKPSKKRQRKSSVNSEKENQRGKKTSVSDIKSEENEGSDLERDWLFRRRSERIFLHQPPFISPVAKVKDESLPDSTSLDKDRKQTDQLDFTFNGDDPKTLPLSPLSLPPAPITEDNNNDLEDVFETIDNVSVVVHGPSNNSAVSSIENVCPDGPRKVEGSASPEPTVVRKENLVDGLKVLYLRDQCFVEATVRNISPPDIYGVVVDRDRSRRPDILSLEELLSKIVNVIQPVKRDQIPPGTRICVLWSGRSNSFYPGTVLEEDDEEAGGDVSAGIPDDGKEESGDGCQVNIDFDDGDTGWFPVEQTRLLPSNFPKQKVEMSLESVLAASRKKRSSSSLADFSAPPKISKRQISTGGEPMSKDSKRPESRLSDHDGRSKELQNKSRGELKLQKSKIKDHKDSGHRSSTTSVTSSEMSKVEQQKNDQSFNKFQDKMSKMTKNDASNVINKNESNLQSEAPRKKESTSAKSGGGGSESKGSIKPTARFNDKVDPRARKVPHFQNIFKEMKMFEQTEEEKRAKSTRDDPSKPSLSAGSRKHPIVIDKVSPSAAKIESTCRDDKRGRQKQTKRKLLRNESSGDEDFAVDDGTSGGKKRKQSFSSCSESGDRSVKSHKGQQTSGQQCVPLATGTNTPLTTIIITTTNSTLGSSLPGKGKRSSSQEKERFEEPAEILSWQWYGAGVKRQSIKGKSRKTFYKAIKRGNEVVEVGNSVVFLSNGKSKFKFVGCVESFWENPDGSKSVKVKWYYHPEETRGGANQIQLTWRALFQSSHEDENDLQTISHKCQILSFKDFKSLINTTITNNNNDDDKIKQETSPIKSSLSQLSMSSSPFLAPVPKATPSFSVTPFTSNLSTLKQNSSLRNSYLAGCTTNSPVCLGSSTASSVASVGCNLPCEVYYLAGTYEPTRNYIWFEPGVPLLKDRDRFLSSSSVTESLLPTCVFDSNKDGSFSFNRDNCTDNDGGDDNDCSNNVNNNNNNNNNNNVNDDDDINDAK